MRRGVGGPFGAREHRRYASSAGRYRVAAALALLVGLLLSATFAPAMPSGSAAAPARPVGLLTSETRSATPGFGTASGFHPAGSGAVLPFYGNNSTFATVPTSDQICALYASSSSSADRLCLAADQNPSAIVLANGDIGVAYSRETSTTSNTCFQASRNTSVRIAFAYSSNGGASFSTPVDLGNNTCTYEQATEPAFGVTSTGTVVGVYVEYNASNASASLGGKTWTPPWNLGWRKNASLGLVTSTTNGASWSTPSTIALVGDYVARPAVATFGQTVYVVYDSLSTTQQVLTGDSQNPKDNPVVSVRLIYSTTDGASWNGPYTLPGLNSSEDDNAMSPSIAVAANGTVAVGYLTNRSCQPTPCKASQGGYFAEDVDVATSSTNGTTWNGPHRVASALIEDLCYGEVAQSPWFSTVCYRYLFEFAPAVSVAYDGTHLLVAYAGITIPASGVVSQYTGVYTAASANGGATWTDATLVQEASADEFYSPSIAVSASGTAYVTFTWENESACSGKGCSPQIQAFSEWVASTTTNGSTWVGPTLIDLYHPPGGLGNVGGDWAGWEASAVVVPSTQKLATFFALPTQYTQTVQTNAKSFTWTNQTFQSNLTVAFPYPGATTTVNFTAAGLATGSEWGVILNGASFRTNASYLPVSGIPVNISVVLGIIVPASSGWEKVSGNVGTLGYTPKFSGPTTAPINFTESIGFAVAYHPSTCSPYYFELSVRVGSSTDTYECSGTTYAASPAFPWYLPSTSTIELEPTVSDTNSYAYWGYWFGSGNGSFTGAGLYANITLDGPINESVWATNFGTGNVTVAAEGLPSTSTFSFDLGGTQYQGSAARPLDLPNVTDGVLPLSNITATSSKSGWQYFGFANVGDELVVPLQQQVNLSFAYIEVGSPLGNVTFAGSGVGAGTAWQLELNGSWYATTSARLSIPLRNGTYPFATVPAVAANGSVAYVPTSPSGWTNVTTGSVYTVPFQFTYRVEATAGLGGSITGPSLVWAAPGATESFNATAQNGYAFAGWTGNGSGAYTGTAPDITVTVGGPIVEVAAFYALPTARFDATFNATGLGPGASWTVFVGGVGYSATSSSLVVPDLLPCSAGAAGTYNLTIPYTYNGSNGTRYTPANYPAHFCVNGGAYTRTIAFTAEYLLTVSATPGGVALAGGINGASNTSLWVPFDESPSITAAAFGNYSFENWNGTGDGAYNGTQSFEQLVLGGPVEELAVFVPPIPKIPPRYTLTLTAAGLPDGVAWGIELAGVGYAASTPTLNVTGLLNGTYPLSVPVAFTADGLTEYSDTDAPQSLLVKGKTADDLLFSASYWVRVSGSAGGNVSPSGAAWYPSGHLLTLVAQPTGTDVFLGWTGNASGAGIPTYSGTNATPPTFKVLGPLTEYAAFGSPPPAAKTVTSLYDSTTVWAGLAVVGALVGLGAGVLLARSRRGPDDEAMAPPADPDDAAIEDPSAMADESGGTELPPPSEESPP